MTAELRMRSVESVMMRRGMNLVFDAIFVEFVGFGGKVVTSLLEKWLGCKGGLNDCVIYDLDGSTRC